MEYNIPTKTTTHVCVSTLVWALHPLCVWQSYSGYSCRLRWLRLCDQFTRNFLRRVELCSDAGWGPSGKISFLMASEMRGDFFPVASSSALMLGSRRPALIWGPSGKIASLLATLWNEGGEDFFPVASSSALIASLMAINAGVHQGK